MDYLTVFSEVVERAGGLTPLAKGLGTPIQTVSNWRHRGIPPNRCREVEAMTGVKVHRLRPHDWADYWPDAGPKKRSPAAV